MNTYVHMHTWDLSPEGWKEAVHPEGKEWALPGAEGREGWIHV